MKKTSFILILSGLFLLNIGFAQTIVQTYEFKEPKIITTADGYSEILYDNCQNMGDEGYPLMPLRGSQALLSQNKEAVSFEILSVSYYPDKEGITIKPASRLFPISQPVTDYEPVPNAEIYNSHLPYPTEIVTNTGTHFLSGHAISTYTVSPVVFLPADKKIRTIKEITIAIHTETTERAINASQFLRSGQIIQDRVIKIIDNPMQLRNYSYPETRNEDYDILLITNEALIDDFQEYIDYKNSTGYNVIAITIQEIYANYSGGDNPERVRNCIIDHYQNSGISFVILGGDTDRQNPSNAIVPHRGFAVLDDNSMASDMYFSNLDGNWNSDGDNKFGEVGEMDLYSEVLIGRICVDNATETQNAINKHILYQNDPVLDDTEKALMIGEELNNSPWTFGGDYKDEIAYGGTYNGYYGVGFSTNIDVSRLYDRAGGWGKSQLFQQFNTTGINLMNHLGHSSPTYNMKMSNSDITTNNLTNNGIDRGFVIGYSQGCYNGSFDNWHWNGYYTEDCFAEKITTIATGEVACIANSRYGWYSPGGTNSSSQYYDRMFFHAIFGEYLSLIGDINRYSKEVNASYMQSSNYYRWVAYEANLFGDPTLDVYTATPTEITATFSPAIPVGIDVVSIETNTPWCRIGLMQNGELIGRGIADENGNINLELFEILTNIETIDISIIAHNRLRYTDTILVITNIPYVIFESYQIDDSEGNGNGIPEYGELISLSLEVKNVGNVDAQDVTVSISSGDEYITITDGSENYGFIAAGEKLTIEGAFTFEVASNIPDDHLVSFEVEAIGEDTWYSDFYITAYAPELTIGSFYIDDDNDGNGNHRLDPGETVIIEIESTNSGHCACFGVTGSIESGCDFITIQNTTYPFFGLMPGETALAYFTVSVDFEAPIGDYINLIYTLEHEAYVAEKSINIRVGLIAEDWETGGFELFNWSFSGAKDWLLTGEEPYEGEWCVRSGNIGDSENTMLMLDYEVPQDDSISFYKKVSSEPGYDHLTFYIDNSQKGAWSGEMDWERVAYAVSAGNHTFRWAYIKGANTANGADCGWVDFIELPIVPFPLVDVGQDTTICAGWDFMPMAAAVNYTNLEWTTSGTGIFDNNGSLTPNYIMSVDDILTGYVTLTLTATGVQNNIASDDLVLTIDECTGISENPDNIQISLFPNPTKGDVMLSIITDKSVKLDVTLWNALSMPIISKTGIDSQELSRNPLNIKDLNSGIYWLVLENKDFRAVKKIVVLN